MTDSTANSKEMQEVAASAIREFVNSMIGALDSGFLDQNHATLAEIHRAAQNHIDARWGLDAPHLVEEWGPEVAKLCGYTGKLE